MTEKLPENVPPPCEACGKVHARDGRATCAGHKSGSRRTIPCNRFPVRGLHVCTSHGGATATARAKGEERQRDERVARAVERARDEAHVLGFAVEVKDVKQALLDLISWSAGHVRYYLDQIQALDPDTLIRAERHTVTDMAGTERGERSDYTQTVTAAAPEVSVWVKLYNEERDRLAKWLVDAARLGIAEAQIRVAQEHGARIAEAFSWLHGLVVARWGLDRGDAEALRGFMKEALASLASGAPFPAIEVAPA